jgi:hypothetical protein
MASFKALVDTVRSPLQEAEYVLAASDRETDIVHCILEPRGDFKAVGFWKLAPDC